MHTRYLFSWNKNCRVIPGVQCKTKQVLKKAKDEHIKCSFALNPHLLTPLLISFSLRLATLRMVIERLTIQSIYRMVSYLHDTRLHSLLIHFVSLCSNVTQFSLRPSLFIVFKIATHLVTYISSAFLPRYISPQHFLPSNALYNLLLWGVFFFHTLCSPTTSPHLPNVSYTWAGIFICFLH